MKKLEKILTFVIYNDKLLLLLGNENDPQFHKSFWYVVTGSVEKEDNTLEDAVNRELMEETGLTSKKIINLDWIFKYESLGSNCIEYAYITFVDSDVVTLNEESIDYRWCNLDEFLSLIKWYSNNEELKKVLSKFINNKNI